jgi:hypothetical protein
MFQRDEGSGDQGRLVGSDRDPVPQSDLEAGSVSRQATENLQAGGDLQSHQDFLECVWKAHGCFVRWLLIRCYQTLLERS